MARKMTKWPSKRRPLTKIRPSDGCKGDGVPLVVDQWYDFHEFGCHLGNVGLDRLVAEYIDIESAVATSLSAILNAIGSEEAGGKD